MIKKNLVLLMLMTGAAQAESGKVYTWTDSAGHVHFSDEAPPNSREVKKSAPGTSQTPPHEVPVAAAAPGGDARAAECQRKREQLITYRNASKVTETDALGKTREYSADEKQKLIDLTETSIHDLCTPE